jgi:hypothetical protein
MKRILSSIITIAAVSFFATACGFQQSSTVLAPTAVNPSANNAPTGASGGPSAPSLVGTWTSSAVPALSSSTTCGQFQYVITTQTATTIAGTFTGVCSGGIALSGNATGLLNGTAVTLTVNGTATVPGTPACPVTLAGTGAIEDSGNTLRVPFSGTTCLGPVNGVEVLHKPQAAAPVAVIDQPAAVSPSPNQILGGLRTRFTVNNATRSGPVGGIVYEFEVAHDEAFTNRFGNWNIPEQSTQTSLDLPIDFAYSNVYYWHVRAFDGATSSGWSVTRALGTPNPPAAAPVSDPTFGCPTADKMQLVQCIHDHINPAGSVDRAFDVTRRVAWALRGEGAGLLIKPGGENIVGWLGYSFAAGRICYPDGHIFKVLSDVPTTNGASWQDNGFVDRSLYVPAIDPNR